jgi:hypothetical protein
MGHLQIIYRNHALLRMMQRGVSPDEIRLVIENGEVIESYPDDQPYPSMLVLGWLHSRALHVVVAQNSSADEMVVITVYEPAPDRWLPGFRRRNQ